jgi:hypothetical protein
MTRTTFTIAALATTFLVGAGSLFTATDADARSRHRHHHGPFGHHHLRYHQIYEPEIYVYRPVKRVKRKRVVVRKVKPMPMIMPMMPANAPAADAPNVNAPNANAPATNPPSVNAPRVDAPLVNGPSKNAPSADPQNWDGAKAVPPEKMTTGGEMTTGDCMGICGQSEHVMDNPAR